MAEDQSWRGKVGKMDADEVDQFLSAGRLVRLACVDHDGWPFVVPMWYEWDKSEGDGVFWVIPRMKSAWAQYLKREPRCAITIDEDQAPYRKVLVKAEAILVEEPNVGGKWVEIATKMSYRYLGENGPKYLEPTLNEPRWLYKLKPVKMTTWQGVDWHKKYVTAGKSE